MKTRVSLAMVVCAVGTANAAPTEIQKVQLWKGLHEVELTIDGATANEPSSYVLRTSRGDENVAASSVRTLAQSDITTDIAVVVQDGFDLHGVDLRQLASVLSQAHVIAYGDGARVIRQGRLATTLALEVPSTGTVKRSLADGIEIALDTIDEDADRRVLIVVGDGADDGGYERLQRLKRFARAKRVQMMAVVRGDGTEVRNVVPMTYAAESDARMREIVQGIIDRLATKRVVTFPEEDAAGHRMRWDGVERELVVSVDGEDGFGYETVVLPRSEEEVEEELNEGCCSPSKRWLVVAIAGLFVAGFAWWNRRAMKEIE